MLIERGVRVTRITDAFADTALSLYDSSGLLVVDYRHAEALETLRTGSALVSVLMIAPSEQKLSPDTLRVDSNLPAEEMAHHVVEILSQNGGFRRYPRIPVNLDCRSEGRPCRVRNASLYGVWLQGLGERTAGSQVDLTVCMSDGAEVNLAGRVVGYRDGGLAVRTRPESDIDLVLWLHLILGALATSPLYADADPFGPLFR
jgi:hypothetical protein